VVTGNSVDYIDGSLTDLEIISHTQKPTDQ